MCSCSHPAGWLLVGESCLSRACAQLQQPGQLLAGVMSVGGCQIASDAVRCLLPVPGGAWVAIAKNGHQASKQSFAHQAMICLSCHHHAQQ